MSITFLGKEIPFYGLLMYFGIIVSSGIGIFLCKKRKFPVWDLVGAGGYAMIGGMIGSKIFFLIVSWKQIMELHLSLEAIIKGGFVFYGGLIGGFLGIVIYAKQFQMKLLDFLDLFAVPLPLGHAFGRLGCFFGGCCYGMEYHGFGQKVYHSSSNLNTPLEIPLFPVQIVSSIGLFLLFVTLLIVFFKSNKVGFATCIYAIAYPVLRFLVEFLRGDEERGIFFGLSVAQWVSLTILAGLTICFFCKKELKKKMV